jgi:hypothetical protein
MKKMQILKNKNLIPVSLESHYYLYDVRTAVSKI